VSLETPSHLHFNLTQEFFGLKPIDQIQLHNRLFDLVWAGNGRWDWNTIYNLPIRIRRLWVKRVNQLNEPDESEQVAAERNQELFERYKHINKVR